MIKASRPSTAGNPSVSSLRNIQGTRNRPSPLRLHPLPADLRRVNHSTTSFGTVGGAPISPPLPSPRSPRSLRSEKPSNWVSPSNWMSPLDVHFSRPTTPITDANPSQLPQPQSSEKSKNELPVLTPKTSVSALKSNSSPIRILDATTPTSTPSKLSPSRVPRQLQRSGHSIGDDGAHSLSRRSAESFRFDLIPPLPQSPSSPRPAKVLPTLDTSSAAEDDYTWDSEVPVLRDSVAELYRISFSRPKTVDIKRPQSRSSRSSRSSQAHSEPTPNTPSTRTSINTFTNNNVNRQLSSAGSSSAGSVTKISPSRSSSRSLRRARDSVKYMPRKAPQRNSDERRRRDHDHRHYKLGQHIHITADQSTISSLSSSSTSISDVHNRGTDEQEPVPKLPPLDLYLLEPVPLTAIKTGTGKRRSISDASQTSIGDFYDAYYRMSILQDQESNSVLAQLNTIHCSPSPEMLGSNVGNALSTDAKRPAPMMLTGDGWVGADMMVPMPGGLI